MKILGSIITLFLPLLLLAQSVHVYLKHNPIDMGEPAQLVIEAEGDEIELPHPQKIAGFPVVGIAKNESVIQKNGEMTIKKEEIITFYPDSNVTIAPLKIKVNGKIIQTKPLQLIVKKASAKRFVQFRMKVNKTEAYVGEPLFLDLILKIKKGLNIIDYNFVPPKLDNFWVKQIQSSNKYLEERGEYLVKRIKFLIIPQKSGTLEIAPAVFKYAISSNTTDLFGFSVSAPLWRSVASNSIKIVAKPLPEDVDLVGDFTIKAKVDRETIKPNEPVNFEVVIDGEGNIENFGPLTLNIPDATIYADKPKIFEKYVGDRMHVTYKQKFSIISDKDFTIPALKVKYFSLKKRKIALLQTKPIKIKVVGAKKATPLPTASIEKKEKQKSKIEKSQRSNVAFSWIAFGLGLFVGIFLTLLLCWIFLLRKSVPTLKFGGKKELLNRLLPYLSRDKEAQRVAKALYEEIYEGKKGRVSKKEIKELLKKYS